MSFIRHDLTFIRRYYQSVYDLASQCHWANSAAEEVLHEVRDEIRMLSRDE